MYITTCTPVFVSSAITCSDCANSSHCVGGSARVSSTMAGQRSTATHPVRHDQDDGVVEDVQKGERLRLEHPQHGVQQLVVLRGRGAWPELAQAKKRRVRRWARAARAFDT